MKPAPVPEPTTTGRERELVQIEGALESARRNRVPAIARVLGGSGIGKTHFLFEVSRGLERRGWFVASATCHMIQQHTPRLVSNRIVAAALEKLDAGATRYTGGLEEALATFDPSIARLVGTSSPSAALDADSYSQVFLRLFEGIAIDHDIALLFDDAQWMDEESARFILTLPQKISTRCVSLAFAERLDGERLQSSKWFPSTEITLGELDFDQSLLLIRQQIGEIESSLAEIVAHHAGGNPFELVALCDELRENGKSGIERSLRARTANQLAALDSDVREFVHICALLGDPIEHRILSELFPDSGALERLIALSGRYVVNAGNEFRFKHAMLAQSVVTTIAVPIPLRRRIIDALQSPNLQELTDYERIAQHAAQCGDLQLQRRALVALAKDAFRRQAWAAAVSAAERALQIVSDKPPDLELLSAYVLSLRVFDREPEAIEVLLQALPKVTAGSAKGSGKLAATLVRMLEELERLGEAKEVFERNVPLLRVSAEKADLLVSGMSMAASSIDEPWFAGIEAQLRELEGAVSSETLASSNVYRAVIASALGDAEGMQRGIAAALVLADGSASSQRERLRFGKMLLDFRQHGCEIMAERLYDLKQTAYFEAGFNNYIRVCEVWLSFFRGDWEAANALIEEYYVASMPLSRAAPLLGVSAAIAALNNTASRFETDIEQVSKRCLQDGYDQSAVQIAPWYLLRNGSPALDKLLHDVTMRLPEKPPRFTVIGYLPWAMAMFAAARGDEELLRLFHTTEEPRDRSPWSRANWQLARDVAASHGGTATQDRASAVEPLRSLSAAFPAAFAARVAGKVSETDRAILERTGVAKKSKHRVGTASEQLTPREREVARAVASGDSNRQIAGQLFLSERTVEVHLSNIFGKLGLSSRAQLVRWVLEGTPSKE